MVGQHGSRQNRMQDHRKGWCQGPEKIGSGEVRLNTDTIMGYDRSSYVRGSDKSCVTILSN